MVAGVVTKCLNARPKTKEASIQVCLMCVEIEQHAVVQVSQLVLYVKWPARPIPPLLFSMLRFMVEREGEGEWI